MWGVGLEDKGFLIGWLKILHKNILGLGKASYYILTTTFFILQSRAH